MRKPIRFRIDDIHIKPYVRMTQRGKYVNKQAQEYLTSKQILQVRMREKMQLAGYEMMPASEPLSVTIQVVAPVSQGHRADLDNIIKAVLDAGNDILYSDDRWIDTIIAHREFDRDNNSLFIMIAMINT